MAEGKYTLTVGLEIHVELKTQTKMFCACKNDPDEREPNVNICPVCMAHPGTLPVINQQAVKNVLRVGEALGSTLADFTEFDRKNYFYPDIPKAYQISQYKYPLVLGGSLHGVEITRIHLEEDTASSQHDPDNDLSMVNFNRAGVPLMELVTEPVIHSAKEAGDFARELQLLLSPLYLDVSEANMEKGEMRVEANISVSNEEGKLGTKVEVKNLNSFRTMEKAIDYEYKRQVQILEEGGKIDQETLGWDENKQATFSQRKKESSHDYRYFPDPDLPKLYISEIADFQNLAETLPELPSERRARYERDYGIKSEDVEVFLADPFYRDLFEYTVSVLGKENSQVVANYITSDLAGLKKNTTGIQIPANESFAQLMEMVINGEVSSRGAKDILFELCVTGSKLIPRAIAEAKGLFQKSDEGEILKIVEQVIAENETVVADYKAGNEKSLQFLVGQGMKLSKGSANPSILNKVLQERLS